jgi:hypothetical protein
MIVPERDCVTGDFTAHPGIDGHMRRVTFQRSRAS